MCFEANFTFARMTISNTYNWNLVMINTSTKRGNSILLYAKTKSSEIKGEVFIKLCHFSSILTFLATRKKVAAKNDIFNLDSALYYISSVSNDDTFWKKT